MRAVRVMNRVFLCDFVYAEPCWNSWSPWTNWRRTIVIGDGGKKEDKEMLWRLNETVRNEKMGVGLQNG